MKMSRIFMNIITLSLVIWNTSADSTVYSDAYEFTLHKSRQNWGGAKDACANYGRLVKIDSANITKIIKQLELTERETWIGASDRNKEGTWVWLDGSYLVYKNWRANEPSGKRKEDCASVVGNGLWNDRNCDDTLQYLCQADLQTSLTYGDRTFTYHRTERADFDEAILSCQSQKRRLVEIYDEITYSRIREGIKNPGANMLIGGKVKSNYDIVWNSGATTSFSANWVEEDYLNDEEVACISFTTEGWKRNPCSHASYAYICETLIPVENLKLSETQVIVDLDSTTLLSCQAGGIPIPEVRWRSFSGEFLPTSASTTGLYQNKIDGQSILHFEHAQLNDEGTYTCSATNYVENKQYRRDDTVHIIVPSTPINVVLKAVSCSSNVEITWIANSRATNVSHRIIFSSTNGNFTIYRKPTDWNKAETEEQVLKSWTNYIALITPCTDECKENYTATSNLATTEGLPDQLEDIALKSTGQYSFELDWTSPRRVPEDLVTEYKVTVNESLHEIAIGESKNIIKTEYVVSGSATKYQFDGRPNRVYWTGIQAMTCAGYGAVKWSNMSYITEAMAPDHIETPTLNQNGNHRESMVSITFRVPTQESGIISCIFVVVRIDDAQDVSESREGYSREKLIQANTSTVEYISVALALSSLSSDEVTVLLGDGKQTECDAHKATSRSGKAPNDEINNLYVGRNMALDQHKNLSIYTVTSTPTNTNLSLQSSDSLHVAPITGEQNTNNVILIVGLVSSLIVVAVVVYGLVMTLRKRKQHKETDQNQDAQYYDIDRAYEISNEPDNEDEGTTNQCELTNEVIYQNEQVMIPVEKRSPTDIPMVDFENTYNAMQLDNGAGFVEQFKEVTRRAQNLPVTTEFSSNPALKGKNRYKNILPFDDSRVPIRSSQDGYINACFIDGFGQRRKFIATQGPLKKTLNDFWTMIYEQGCSVIVMLAKCFEGGKAKCEKYWPDLGETTPFGPLTLQNTQEVHFCGFVRRTFKISADFETEGVTRTVTQYHFLKWPDHGFPVTTSYIMRLHLAVMESWKTEEAQNPIVVHCSAGAGRTGTFIGYDILLNESKSIGNADVFNAILDMRRQRVDMVQNCDQYILVHKLIVESYLYGNTDISGEEVPRKFSDKGYRRNTVTTQFSDLSRVKPIDMSRKNMIEKVSAYDRMKIKTYNDEGVDIGSSLNASFVEVYDESSSIIVSRHPTKSNMVSFWKLVYDSTVSVLVTISDNQDDLYQYWQDDGNFENYTVRIEYGEKMKNFEITKLKITQRETRSVTHFHLQTSSTEASRRTIMKLNACVDKVMTALRESNGVALIHCKNGTGMSGVFCGALNLIERLKVENRVDVFRAIKDLRDCKEGMVETIELYDLCHDIVVEYFHNFETYSNFK